MSDENTPPPLREGETLILPLLPLRDIVIFPESLTPLFVGRPRSVAALETAMKSEREGTERRIVLSAQRTARTEEPGPDDQVHDELRHLGPAGELGLVEVRVSGGLGGEVGQQA